MTALHHHIRSSPGMVAFWDFAQRTQPGGPWCSYAGVGSSDLSYPVFLCGMTVPGRHVPETWPGTGAAALERPPDGPFGPALRIKHGHVFAELARSDFAGSALESVDQGSFTMVAWVRWIGKRHLVCGIWDEGGWERYAGRRQYALFSGLFGQRGVIAHVSATGAACHPQSSVAGAEYARTRAIDAKPIPDGCWSTMGMTVDRERQRVTAWLGGVASEHELLDPVIADALGPENAVQANPLPYPWIIYRPDHFVLKLAQNGTSAIRERWVEIDLARRCVSPKAWIANRPVAHPAEGRLIGEIHRDGITLPGTRREWLLTGTDAPLAWPELYAVRSQDAVVCSLEIIDGPTPGPCGPPVTRKIEEGAPFSFGRALGLGKQGDRPDKGGEFDLGGVCLWNRALGQMDMQSMVYAVDPGPAVR